MNKLKRKKSLWGYLFILPNFIGFLMFMFIPIMASLGLSFTDYDIISKMNFVGLRNYIRLFSDEKFIKAILHTIYFAVLTVPTGMALALLLAVLLNKPIRGIKIFRTFMFIPVVTSSVAVALVWGLLYDDYSGLFNNILNSIGLPPVGWLTDSKIAMVSIAIMSIWKGLGYNMTVFLAGLQGVPSEIYEAATIDGANSIHKFFKITIPLIGPTTYFVSIMSLIGSLQVFDQVWIMTKGGPIDSTSTIATYLYQNAFQYYKMGYASAAAYVLFIIIMIMTLIQSKSSKKWAEN